MIVIRCDGCGATEWPRHTVTESLIDLRLRHGWTTDGDGPRDEHQCEACSSAQRALPTAPDVPIGEK